MSRGGRQWRLQWEQGLDGYGERLRLQILEETNQRGKRWRQQGRYPLWLRLKWMVRHQDPHSRHRVPPPRPR